MEKREEMDEGEEREREVGEDQSCIPNHFDYS
jgi:hypothetical protein